MRLQLLCSVGSIHLATDFRFMLHVVCMEYCQVGQPAGLGIEELWQEP